MKNYYEILGVEKTATTEEIINAYNNLPSDKKDSEEISTAFRTLSNPKKRSKYNIKIKLSKLKTEESKQFKSIVDSELTSEYDNYYRKIYIQKYKNKIEFLKKQIEVVQNEKNKNSLSQMIVLSNLVAQLEQAKDELSKWEMGRNTKFDTKTITIRGIELSIPIRGKGTEHTLASWMLSKSIKRIEKIENDLNQRDVSNIEKIMLSLKGGFWKNVKTISSGTIKLHATTWSRIQDIVIRKPNLFVALTETEEKLEKRISKAVK